MSQIEQIRQRLVDSYLLSAEEADSRLADWRDETSAWQDVPDDDFVDWLIEQRAVTEFQGDAILRGHIGPFMLGPYRVHEQIAPGWLGGVYRGVQEEFGQQVSLKIFPSSLQDDEEKVARLGREARILAEIDHPNVFRCFEVSNVGDIYYMALEELRGETLADRLERDGRLPYRVACTIARDVARGLKHLHEHDIIHRDLRPEHIWISENGVTKIIEFGAARDAFAEVDTIDGRNLTVEQTVIGKYEYMSPEQAQNASTVTASADIYGLGCVLYHCLAGHPPFTDVNPVKLVLKHVSESPPRISDSYDDVPQQIDETIASMLGKTPDDRFQSSEDVAYALTQYGDDDSAEESIAIVNVSPSYQEWIQSGKKAESNQIADDAVAMTPELTQFLGWMSGRKVSRGPRNRTL